MFISQQLSRQFHNKGAHVLLQEQSESDGFPKLVIREVETIWGHYKNTGYKGGICFPGLSDGTTHIEYNNILGYNTGDKASIQELLLHERYWAKRELAKGWQSFIKDAAQLLLEARPVTKSYITVDYLTTPNYWFMDNWYGHILKFVWLCDAKREAKKQTGMSVSIHEYATGALICFAPASGNCPP